MSSWNDIIDEAFIDLGVIQPGMSITTAMRTDAQKRFNQLLGQLSTEDLTVHTHKAYTGNLLAGITAYTVGSGGSINTGERVQRLTAWRAYYGSLLHSAGQVLSFQEFGGAQQQNGQQASVPSAVAADTAYPLINLRVFPPPSSQPGVIEVFGWTPVPQIADFTATIALPDGWEQMLHFNLAVALAPQYARQGGVSPELAANAQNSKASLVSQNAPAAPAQQQ